MGELLLPPEASYAVPSGRYFHYVWDTTGVPLVQEGPGPDSVLITPEFHNLHIYGREIKPDPDDVRDGLVFTDRILGQWYSIACPEGEVGTVPLGECDVLTGKQFSAAYQRGWEPEGE